MLSFSVSNKYFDWSVQNICFRFVKRNRTVIAQTAVSQLGVEILSNHCHTSNLKLKNVLWLLKKQAPVEIKDGKIIIIPSLEMIQRLNEKERQYEVQKEMMNYARLTDKGVAYLNNPTVQERLRYFNQLIEDAIRSVDKTKNMILQVNLDFHITSPEDLYAANVAIQQHLQSLLHAGNYEKSHYFNGKVFAHDFSQLVNEKGQSVAKEEILAELENLNLINTENCLIPKPENLKEKMRSLYKKFGKKVAREIYDILFCINFRNSREFISTRAIQKNELNPDLLCKMSQGRMSYEEANLIIENLSLSARSKLYKVTSLYPNIWEQNSQKVIQDLYPNPEPIKNKLKVLVAEKLNGLEDKKRDNLIKEYRKRLDNPLCQDFGLKLNFVSKEMQRSQMWSQDEFFKLCENYTKTLKSYFGNLVSEEFLADFFDTYSKKLIGFLFHYESFELMQWHSHWRKAINQKKNLESDFEKSLSQFDENFLQIVTQDINDYVVENECTYTSVDLAKEKILYALDQLSNVFYKDLQALKKSNKTISLEKLLLEQNNISLHAQKEKITEKALQKLFNDNKHIIKIFIKSSGIDIESQPVHLNVNWIADGVKILDQIQLQTSGLASRRLEFVNRERKDLPYFSLESKKDQASIVKEWKQFLEKNQLTDAELANMCLLFYKNGKIVTNSELKQFIIPLVFLILGKEPAMDSASYLTNYMLLLSVSKKLMSFEEALRLMPMIPQGAVAARQFLASKRTQSIEWLANSQSDKTGKNTKNSIFFPSINAFEGSATKWIQKYDEVTEAFVHLCVDLIFKEDASIPDYYYTRLQYLLSRLYNHQVPRSELAYALAEESGLIDGEDLVGEFVIDLLSELHPLYYKNDN